MALADSESEALLNCPLEHFLHYANAMMDLRASELPDDLHQWARSSHSRASLFRPQQNLTCVVFEARHRQVTAHLVVSQPAAYAQWGACRRKRLTSSENVFCSDFSCVNLRRANNCYIPLEASADDEAVWHIQKADEACKDAGYQNMLSSKSPATTAEATERRKREAKRQQTNAEAAQGPNDIRKLQFVSYLTLPVSDKTHIKLLSASTTEHGLDITKWTLFSNAFAGEEYATCVPFRALFQDRQLVVMRHEERSQRRRHWHGEIYRERKSNSRKELLTNRTARTRIDIQKRLPAFQPSYHPHPTKWYGPSQTTCFTTTDTDISSEGTRSIWSQEAKEEVVQGQGESSKSRTIHQPEYTASRSVKDKAQHAVILDKATSDRLQKEVQSYRLVTVATLVDRLKINGSLARRSLADLEEQGQIKKVVSHSKCLVYTRAVGGTD
ncbi:hypothetical protein KCU81_g238, partial [Aureobasidium melanogenum]